MSDANGNALTSLSGGKMTLRTLLRMGIGLLMGTMAFSALAVGQENGQPASDVLGLQDLWENPTFVGGVTNDGPAGHSIW
jgi:hypothetical protein